MKRRPVLIIIAILTILGFLAPATSQAQERTGPVPVAASLCPPFVIGEADKLDGLAIFLWDRVARELGLDYDIKLMNFGDMIDSVAAGQSAVGISCLSITSEREERVDFSHSFFETHKAIGIKKASYLSSIRQFLLMSRCP